VRLEHSRPKPGAEIPLHLVVNSLAPQYNSRVRPLNLPRRCSTLREKNDRTALLAAFDAGLSANSTRITLSHTETATGKVTIGKTLLTLAAYSGRANLVKELVTRGADADALNDNLRRPIAGAIVRILAQAGADPRNRKLTATETGNNSLKPPERRARVFQIRFRNH